MDVVGRRKMPVTREPTDSRASKSPCTHYMQQQAKT